MDKESTIRSGRKIGFTTLYNNILHDKRLSLKAKGLFAIMQSLPCNWRYTVSGLVTVTGEGRTTVRAALNELYIAGYLVRSQGHDDGGKFSGCTYTLIDIPEKEDPPLSENLTTAETQSASEFEPWSGKPTSEKPTAEKPTSENLQLINNNIYNTPQPPIDGGGACCSKKADWKLESFEAFWKAYIRTGRTQAKAKARRAWNKLKPSDELISRMMQALERQMQSDDWKRGIGIPYCATWINGERWEDTIAENAQNTPQEAAEAQQHVPTYVGTRIDPETGQEVDVYE